MTVLLFLAVLFVLVLVHEWGHFIVAKKTGMRVDEFGIGLPPKLFGVTRGETTYTLNALPIGGFVKIHGENGEGTELLSAQNGEEGGNDANMARSFAARPKWAQALVLIAGVAMNIIFAWFLFVVILLIGVPSAVEEGEASQGAELTVVEVVENAPAATAGLQLGDVVTELKSGDDFVTDVTPSALRAFVAAHPDEEIVISYIRNGEEVLHEARMTAATEVIETATATPAIGLATALVETEQVGFLTALIQGAQMTKDYLVAIVVGICTFFGQIFTGTADFNQVAGPVGIAGMVGDAAAIGFTSLLLFTAIISLNLAVINMLPIPALDGGRLVFVAIEAVTGKTIPPVWANWVNTVGFVLLIGLMILVTVSDVGKLW